MLGLSAGDHTFVVFEISERPVRVSVVARAIDELKDERGFVVIGGEFTVAAFELLAEQDALFVTRNGANWSEQSWDHVRTLI